jgi:hypothetical protein
LLCLLEFLLGLLDFFVGLVIVTRLRVMVTVILGTRMIRDTSGELCTKQGRGLDDRLSPEMRRVLCEIMALDMLVGLRLAMICAAVLGMDHMVRRAVVVVGRSGHLACCRRV